MTGWGKPRQSQAWVHHWIDEVGIRRGDVACNLPKMFESEEIMGEMALLLENSVLCDWIWMIGVSDVYGSGIRCGDLERRVH